MNINIFHSHCQYFFELFYCHNLLTFFKKVQNNKLMSMISGNKDIIVPWERIKCMGEDVILVEIDPNV